MPKFNIGFQTYFYLGCVAIVIIAIAAFALIKPPNPDSSQGGTIIPTITMWGTLPPDYFSGFRISGDPYLEKIVYTQYSEAELSQRILEGLANQNPPDLLLLSNQNLRKHSNRILQIPYESFSKANFTNTYVDAAAAFTNNNGTFAIPIIIDPMVLYYNRDHLKQATLLTPPTTWTELRGYDDRLTITDGFTQVNRGSIALGTANNVDYVKNIISTLYMQVGSPMVTDDGLSRYQAGVGPRPTDVAQALDYYVTFANPQTKPYSWTVTMPNSRQAFVSGLVSMYLAPTSEYNMLSRANPNLDVGVGFMPQVAETATDAAPHITHANLYGVAVVNSQSAKLTHAYQAAFKFLDPNVLAQIEVVNGTPSVMKRRLVPDPNFAYTREFTSSAILAETWLESDPEIVSREVTDMIGSVRSGSGTSNESVDRFFNRI